MTRTTLKIDGMMCGMCESHVNDAIRKAFPAVKKVTSSHGKGETVIISEDPLDEAQVKAAIAATGYDFKGSRIRRSVSFSSDGFFRTTKSRAVSGVEVVLLFVFCVS